MGLLLARTESRGLQPIPFIVLLVPLRMTDIYLFNVFSCSFSYKFGEITFSTFQLNKFLLILTWPTVIEGVGI